ncbi:MAG: ferredoxin--NADP reductase [Chitinophagaceae bacterium]|nr:ferredoxin--NADP reductase [Chitinophagaceae bacterium]
MNDGLFSLLKIKEVIAETNDFKTFVFEEGHDIKYESGQFLTLVHQSETGETRRSYSITSSPILNEPLAIGVKRIENGFFSRMMTDTVKAGDILLSTGASGFFRLPADINNYNKVIFFAAGSGITPVFSLIKTVLFQHPHIHVTLIYSNHSENSTVYYDELLVLQNKFPGNLTIHFLFSNSIDLLRARLNRDLFFDLLYSENPDIDRTLFYLCGPPSYMRMVIYLLEEFGVEENHIRKEDFVPILETGRKNIPPDTHSYLATIHFNKNTYRFAVNYPDSILRAAKKEHIILPYSCENGRCGTCAAYCLHGQIWLSNNEVLTTQDMQKGLTLTCVGHPLNGDVELEIK